MIFLLNPYQILLNTFEKRFKQEDTVKEGYCLFIFNTIAKKRRRKEKVCELCFRNSYIVEEISIYFIPFLLYHFSYFTFRNCSILHPLIFFWLHYNALPIRNIKSCKQKSNSNSIEEPFKKKV